MNIINTATLEEIIAFRDSNISTIILHFIGNIDLGNLNRTRSESKEIMALNYEITTTNYSDTLSGQTLCLIYTGCMKIGLFYEEYLKQLENYFHSHISPSRQSIPTLANPLNNFMLKLSILSHPSLFTSRFPELPSLVENFTHCITACWNDFRPEEAIQSLRFLLNFASSSNKKLVETCIQLCMDTLVSNPGSDSWNDCHDIMMELPEN